MEIKNLQFEHLIRTPKIKKSEKPPALILFHGYGSNEDDLFSFVKQLPDYLFIISARAPHTIAPMGYAWYHISFDEEGAKRIDENQAVAARDGIHSFIQSACASYNLDEQNISLLGFSQGAILSLAVAMTYPKTIKNIVALSGYWETKIIDIPKNEQINTNVYVSHGEEDKIIPITLASQIKPQLEKLGLNYTYETYSSGHSICMENFRSFNNWIKKHI